MAPANVTRFCEVLQVFGRAWQFNLQTRCLVADAWSSPRTCEYRHWYLPDPGTSQITGYCSEIEALRCKRQEAWNVKTLQEDPVQIFHWSIWGRDISWTPNMAWSLGSVAPPIQLVSCHHFHACRILERELGGQGGLKNILRDKATWMEATDGDWEWRCLHGVSQSAIVQAPSLSTKHPKNTTPGGKCCAWLNVNSAD